MYLFCVLPFIEGLLFSHGRTVCTQCQGQQGRISNKVDERRALCLPCDLLCQAFIHML